MPNPLAALGVGVAPLAIDDLDDLDNQFSVCALKLLRSAYGAGALVRLRRVSDNVESDFSADGSGWVDSAAITTWLSGSSAKVTTVYDQTGNSRNWVQTTAARQPDMDLSGSYPRMAVLDATSQYLVASTALKDFGRNIAGISLAAVAVFDEVSRQQSLAWNSRGDTQNGARSGWQLQSGNTFRTHSGPLDSGASSNSTTPSLAPTVGLWLTTVAAYNWAGGLIRHMLNSSLARGTFTATALSADTAAVNMWWGSRGGSDDMSGKLTAMVYFHDVLTDEEMIALSVFLDALKAT